jgi:nucleotide-binding universal stress UspA family protein
MYPKIVVGYDASSEADDALALAVLLRSSTDASLVLGYVSTQQPRWYSQDRDYLRQLRDHIQSVVERATERLGGIQPNSFSISAPSVAHGLHDIGAGEDASLLVIGSTHRGPVGRVLIGSVGELLLAAAPCAVAVAPRGFTLSERRSLETIGAAFDGSPESELALERARALGVATGARLCTISVVKRAGHRGQRPDGNEAHPEPEAIERRLDELAVEDSERRIVHGSPAKALADAAHGLDLLVVGSRGYGPIRHALLGSVSSKLMRTLPAPLLVVPRGPEAQKERLHRSRASSVGH